MQGDFEIALVPGGTYTYRVLFNWWGYDPPVKLRNRLISYTTHCCILRKHSSMEDNRYELLTTGVSRKASGEELSVLKGQCLALERALKPLGFPREARKLFWESFNRHGSGKR